MIKLMVSDMDGTILDNEGKLSEDFFPLFAQLKERGVLFAIGTGRQKANVEIVFEKVADDLICMAENGAYVVYKGQDLFSRPIPRPLVKRLLEKAETIPETAAYMCSKDTGYLSEKSARMDEVIRHFKLVYEHRDSLYSVEEDIYKFSLCNFINAKTHSYPIMAKEFDAELEVTTSGAVWLDITQKNVNKGAALAVVQDKFGITPEETVIVGDNDNDLSMVSRAYYSFAVANASHKMKELARFGCPSNEDGGVLEVMRKVLRETL